MKSSLNSKIDCLKRLDTFRYRSLELANTRYREGYESFQSVLDAQRTVASTVQNEVINDSNHINSVIRFYAALGGGWVPAQEQDLIPEATRETMESRSDWGRLISAPIDPETAGSYPASQENTSDE